MKNNSISGLVSKVLIGSVILIAGSHNVLASEVTGTLSTGLGNGSVSGVVVQMPAASPVAGAYTGTQSVTLTSPASLSIYYTIDGTVPACSVGTLYTGAISVASTITVKAVACYANNVSSAVASHAYVISAPAVVSSGGGGGGFTAFFPTQVATTSLVFNLKPGCTSFTGFSTTTNQPCSNVSNAAGVVLGASTVVLFTKDLNVGSRNQEVIELQKVLIAQGFLGTDATGYFGALTRKALMLWQTKNKLPVTGSFKKIHRDYLNGSLSGSSVVVPAPGFVPVVTKRYMFLSDLALGTRGIDVTELQKVLITENLLVTAVFGTFGPATKSAVIKWQSKNGLPATGYFGPASRAFMNTRN